MVPSHNASQRESTRKDAILEICLLASSFSQFYGVKMTAQEQMKKMLDELMGTKRDGEYCDKKLLSFGRAKLTGEQLL